MGEKDLYAYLFIQKRLLDCSDEENKIDYKEAISHIIISRFPKVLFSKFIKEMCIREWSRNRIRKQMYGPCDSHR